MKNSLQILILSSWLPIVFSLVSCKNNPTETLQLDDTKRIQPLYANGFYVHDYSDFQILTVTSPWNEATQNFQYVLAKRGVKIPDSLNNLALIRIPPEKVVVTSTTHIPSLEMLNVQNSLVGFPETDYISSPKTRRLIEEGKVINLGANEQINSELLLSLKPDVLVGFSIDQNNKSYKNFEKSGIPVIFNGDWTENTPLGRAEWIKFFGYLFDKSFQAESIFQEIEMEYAITAAAATKTSERPTVLSGTLFKDIWYLPAGESWQARFFEDAGAKYLWAETKGTGSLSLSIENVLDKARQAEYWVGVDSFTELDVLTKANLHYSEISAVRSGNVYSYSATNSSGFGNRYFELAPNRPDLVLKDLVKIFHPDLLPDHPLTFYKKLE